MSIPATWPTPNNAATRVRVFRVEIERPLNCVPVLHFHLQEAVEAGTTSFLQHRPDFQLSVSLVDALADMEIGAVAAQVAAGLEQIAYALYERKKAALEAPPEVGP